MLDNLQHIICYRVSRRGYRFLSFSIISIHHLWSIRSQEESANLGTTKKKFILAHSDENAPERVMTMIRHVSNKSMKYHFLIS
jgi:hypothetical protein